MRWIVFDYGEVICHRTTELPKVASLLGVPYFPIYQLRHVFCTRVSKVAPDAVIQKAMRHSSPETKRFYQLGMVEEVRKAMEHGNQKFYGDLKYHVFITVTSEKPQPTEQKWLRMTGA